MRNKSLTSTKGKPPAWTPPITNAKLKEDNGNYFRDPNAARHPAHPMEPAVQAILAVDHDFNATSVDIFACSSTLGNLLRFVRKIDTPFRMLVEAVGDTVFLVRRENTPTEPIQNIYGYGHAFPEAYTTWEVDVKGSECCQRVVRYDFGGLNCLMRFHADGYYKDLVDSGQSRSQRTVEPARIDNLEDMLVSAFDKSTIATRPSTPHKPLTVIQGGQRIPQSSIFDVKTRSIRKKDHENTLSEELPRLWLAQIPNFILAYHASGLFWEIQKRNVRHEIQDWERNNQDTLHRFAALLRKIIAFAHDRKDGRFELRRREVDVLELREQGGDVHSTLPTAVAARWVADPSILSEHPREGSQRPGSEIGSQPDKGHEHDHPSEGDKAAVVRGVS